MRRVNDLIDLLETVVYPHGSIFQPLRKRYDIGRTDDGGYTITFEIPGISPDKVEIE